MSLTIALVLENDVEIWEVTEEGGDLRGVFPCKEDAELFAEALEGLTPREEP